MNMSDDLDKLAEIGVPKLHIEILRWFRKSGKPFGSVVNDNAILNGKRVRPGKNGKIPVPPHSGISKPHYKHQLVRGGYKPKDDDFVLSIRCTDDPTEHGYKNEVSFDKDGWTKITYDHSYGTKIHTKYGKRIHEEYYELPSLVECCKNKIPIGVIWKPKGGKTTKNKILGLGLITSMGREVSGVWNKKEGRRFLPLNYTIKPYDPNKQQKVDKIPLKVLYPATGKALAKKDYSSSGKRTTRKAREKSSYFKEQLVIQYDNKCAMCTFSSEGYMIGAHIVPFSKMQKWKGESFNAMNPKDGLLLCRYCDIAFERGDITVDEKYRIKKSSGLVEQSRKNKPIKSWLACVRQKIYVKRNSMFEPGKNYLKKKLELIGEAKPDKADEVVGGVR